VGREVLPVGLGWEGSVGLYPNLATSRTLPAPCPAGAAAPTRPRWPATGLARPGLGPPVRASGEVTLVVDCTGVGKGVWEMLGRRMPTITRKVVFFTSGQNETQPEYNVHRVPKVDLVKSMTLVKQGKRWEVVPDLPLLEDLLAELGALDEELSLRTGHRSYGARAGYHDDLVSALVLALWWGDRGSHSAADAYIAWQDKTYGPPVTPEEAAESR